MNNLCYLFLFLSLKTISITNGDRQLGLRFSPKAKLFQEEEEKDKDKEGNEVHDLYDSIIVGAGWSGLGAAKTLQAKGINNFIILDAHDYIGGRSKTSVFPGTNVKFEEGSYALNNIDDNEVYDFAKTNGVPTSSLTYTNEIRSDKGKCLKKKEQNEYWRHYDGINGHWSSMWKDLERDSSMSDVIDDYMVLNDANDHVKTRRLVNAAAEVAIDYEYAADPSRFAVKFGNNNLNYTDSHAVPDNGYSSIVYKYAESLESKIQLNAKVTKVRYRKNSPAKVTYVDKNGDTIVVKGKTVLMTVPIGVLKADMIEFNPPFFINGIKGARKQEAINNLSGGKLEKVILYFENMEDKDIFWNHKKDLTMIVAGKSQGNYTFLHNGYSSSRNQRNALLYCYITGDYASTVAEKTDEQVVAEFVERLRQYYKGVFKQVVVPEPSHYFVTRWMTDEYTRGIYTYAQVGAHRDIRDHMAEPLDGRLFFAGEHTIESRLGSAHGALLSGRRAGREINKVLSDLS